MTPERDAMDDEVFTIQVRRCKRCGRLLTSKEAVERGYGCQCLRKEQEEARAKEPIPGQMNLLDGFGEEAQDDVHSGTLP